MGQSKPCDLGLNSISVILGKSFSLAELAFPHLFKYRLMPPSLNGCESIQPSQQRFCKRSRSTENDLSDYFLSSPKQDMQLAPL